MRISLAVLACIWLPSVAVAQRVDPALAGREIESVEFEGAVQLDDDLLMAGIATRPTSCRSPFFGLFCRMGDYDWAEEVRTLDPAEALADAARIETIYEIWGFPDARAELTVEALEDGDVAVVFDIVEGAPILVERVAVEGLDALSPPVELRRPLPLAEGEPYALPRLEATEEAVLQAFADRGRPFAAVTFGGDVDAASRTARVTLAVEPGPPAVFGPVTVTAESPIAEEVVRRALAFRPGDPWSPEAVRVSEERLYGLPIVERAVIRGEAAEPAEGEASAKAAVEVLVEARPVHGLEAEGTVSSTHCLEGAVRWQHRWLAGGPRLLTLGAGVANLGASLLDGAFPCTSTGEGAYAEPEYFAEAALRQTWPGAATTSAVARTWVSRRSAPAVYVQHGWGAELGLGRQLGRRLFASTTYAHERMELEAAELYYCGSYGVCSDAGVAALAGPTTLAPLRVTAFWRTPIDRDAAQRQIRFGAWWEEKPPQDWWAQVNAGAEAAGAATLSDHAYTRAIVEASATRFLGRVQLAGRARLGAITGAEALPPQVRLYTGGPNTVRGAAQNLAGPRVLLAGDEVVRALGCELRPSGCPQGTAASPDLVAVRAVGGDRLVEGSVEVRYQAKTALQLAAFVDWGWLSIESDENALLAGAASRSLLSPGVGLRLMTELGPVRLDLALDPSGPETLPLLAQAAGGLVALGDVRFDPFGYDDAGALTRFWRRLELHVAIGQPF